MRTFSYTKISTYEQCPQKYKFRYVDEIRPSHQTIEQLVGQTVHLCLRKLHEDAQAGRTVSEEEIADYYTARWKEDFCTSTKIVRRDASEKDYFEGGKRMVLSYYRRFHPIDTKTLVGVELELNFPLAERVGFQAVVDRLTRPEPGFYEIHDYKTSRRLPSSGELKENTQLLLYEIGLRHQHPDAQRVSLVWHYLAHDKEIRVEKSSEQLDLVRANALKTIARIGRARSFPTKVTRLCDWCEYTNLCPAMRKVSGKRTHPAYGHRQSGARRYVSHSKKFRRRRGLFGALSRLLRFFTGTDDE